VRGRRREVRRMVMEKCILGLFLGLMNFGDTSEQIQFKTQSKERETSSSHIPLPFLPPASLRIPFS
jgi:hypothetical protein